MILYYLFNIVIWVKIKHDIKFINRILKHIPFTFTVYLIVHATLSSIKISNVTVLF